jgi:hypothetical protein
MCVIMGPRPVRTFSKTGRPGVLASTGSTGSTPQSATNPVSRYIPYPGPLGNPQSASTTVTAKSLLGARLRTKAVSQPGAAAQPLSQLPDFIALPRDEAGRPTIPQSSVTAPVEAQDAWHQELGSLDAMTSAIIQGLLVMPKISSPSQRKELRNQDSWEDDQPPRRSWIL